MSRNDDYKFVDTDAGAIKSRLVATYEKETKHTLKPADPDMLNLAWVAATIVEERVNQNYVGNQNIPSRAEGVNLDALGEWIYSLKRKAAQAAKCTMRFYITAAQKTAVAIPAGTRVSDTSGALIWSTTEDVLISIGDTYVDVMALCDTPGEAGNGYAEGQINVLIDVDNIMYFSSCENITESDGGAEAEDDDTYFEMMRASLDSYSTAGAEGSYIYWAKSVSDNIIDVKAIRPRLLREETLPVYSYDGGKYAFIGGDQLDINTLKIPNAALGIDYTVEYENGLLCITVSPTGTLASLGEISASVEQDRAGYVYIYALMNDGTLPTEEIKTAILGACNAESVRPLTDYVSVHDPEIVEYDINCTYYISQTTKLSLADIQVAVNNAVGQYITWQRSKIGRDINPSMLQSMLMQAGIKRVDIISPSYTPLHSGTETDCGIPQVAVLRNMTVTNGGYEDE